jgi:hypothetical protein
MTNRMIAAAGLLCLTAAIPVARCDDADNARARLNAARNVYNGMIEQARTSYRLADSEQLYLWSRRWMDAERDLATKEADRFAAVEGHFDRMKKWEEFTREAVRKGFAAPIDLTAQEFYRLEAEQWLARAKAK